MSEVEAPLDGRGDPVRQQSDDDQRRQQERHRPKESAKKETNWRLHEG
jgi:hypothetical protein